MVDSNIDVDFYVDYDDLLGETSLVRDKRETGLEGEKKTLPPGSYSASDPYDLLLTDSAGVQLARMKTSRPILLEVIQPDSQGLAPVVVGNVSLTANASVTAVKTEDGNLNVVLSYKDISGPSDKFNVSAQEVKISFMVMVGSPRSDYWNVSAIVASLSGSLTGKSTNVPLNLTADVTPRIGRSSSLADVQCTNGYGICAPQRLSWSCSSQVLPPLALASMAATDYSLRLTFTGLQLQLGNATTWSFTWDCDPLISIGLWSTLLVTLLLLSVITYALAMLSTVATPDKYDDPKGPVLNLGQQAASD